MNDAAAAARSRMVKTHQWEAPNGEVFEARVPTQAQLLIFFASIDDEEVAEVWRSVVRFLEATFKQEGDFDRIYELMEEGEIDIPDIIGEAEDGTSGDGVKSLIAQLTEAASGGRPTKSSDDSSEQSGASRSGKRSTGRSPGKGSIRSTSRSTGS